MALLAIRNLHTRFASDRSSQQGLASTRRAVQQYTFGNATTELLKFFGALQEVNDFLQIRFDAFQARDIIEGRALFARLITLGR